MDVKYMKVEGNTARVRRSGSPEILAIRGAAW